MSFPVQDARGRARPCLCSACSEPQRIWRSTQKKGHKFKVTAMRDSCWLFTLQQQVYPGPRGLSQLCQWPRLTRPSVRAQTAHSLPSSAAQIFTIHRQYRACYGLANEQLFKPRGSPSSPVLISSIQHEREYCLFLIKKNQLSFTSLWGNP